MINFIQPYSFELNIGDAYNEAIEPLEGWICLTDQDTLKFDGFAHHIKDVIETIDERTIFTCMTNRLRKDNRQVIIELFDETNIEVHFNKFASLWALNGTKLTDADVIAGVCMVFHKSIWERIKFVNAANFDRVFTAECKNRGYKIKLATGIYIFHLYRWGKKNPESSFEHLFK